MRGDYVTIYDTAHLDAEFRVFTYPALTTDNVRSFDALITAGITPSLSTWTDPDTGVPANWTEITSRTFWAGSFKTQMQDATIDWQATLSGENYDDTLLGLGCPVVMWRRYGLPQVVNSYVVDGPFEAHGGTADDNTTDTFTDWTSEASDVANIIDATATVYSGTRAVKIVLASSGYANVWRAATVTGGREHSLTCYARGTTAAKAGLIVTDAADDAVIASSVTAVTTDWARITLNFTTPAACTSVNIVLSPDVAGTVYYDAVNLNMYNPWTMEPWEREFVGQIVAGDYADDYRLGQQWQRTVAGVGYNIGRKNAPRLVFGPYDVMEGATVTASDTLADVSLETDKSEFFGGVASVDEDNLVDGKLNTGWISSSTPLITEDFYDSGTGTILYPTDPHGNVLVSEVFFAPAGGQAVATAWWFEVYCYRATDVKGFYITIGSNPTNATEYTQAMTTCWQMPDEYALKPGRFGIVCGSRTIFERMTGGAPGAQWVFDVSTLSSSVPALNQTDGFVSAGQLSRDTLIWAPAGATRKVQLNNSLGTEVKWNAGAPTYPAVAAFDSDGIGATSGYSIRKKAADYLEADADAAHFEINTYPSPGAHSSDRGGVSLLVELPENTDYLKDQITVASTTVELRDGTLYSLNAGSIYVDGGDTFAYTGRSGNILTGVSGISSTHAADTQIWNYGAFNMFGTSPSATPTSAKQTGYPIANFGWQRRRTPVPTDWLLYTSYLDGASVLGFQESGFLNTYYNAVKSMGAYPADALSWSTKLNNNGLSWQWIRCFLFVINQMSDLGRAKLNEMTAMITPTYSSYDPQIGPGSSLTWIADHPTSDSVFLYLLDTYMGMETSDLDPNGMNDYEHQFGTLATSLRPLSEVLNDLARQTGCLFYPSPSGIVYWLDDPRWPITMSYPATAITTADMRGQLQWSDNATACDWIILNATIPYKETQMHLRMVYPPPIYPATEPATGLQGEEIDSYTIGTHWEACYLAEHLYRERQNDGSASLTMKAATALRAGQMIRLTYAFDGTATTDRRYMVEEVEELRSGAGRARRLEYRVSLRRYYD